MSLINGSVEIDDVITEKARDMYEHLLKHGELSVRRLRLDFGFTSNGGVYYHLNRLLSKDLIEFNKKKHGHVGRPNTFVKVNKYKWQKKELSEK